MMNRNLWNANTPSNFWRFLCPIPEDAWRAAIQQALEIAGLPRACSTYEDFIEQTLAEGVFGERRWNLSVAKRFYYSIKPLIPRWMIQRMRQVYNVSQTPTFPLGWPIEERYVRFQWNVARFLMQRMQVNELPLISFWAEGKRFAFILTHDIETAEGQAHVRRLAELEADLGFRSSFNFIPERYKVDKDLMEYLRHSGFEIGVHGLKHDGKLYISKEVFEQRAKKINEYLQK